MPIERTYPLVTVAGAPAIDFESGANPPGPALRTLAAGHAMTYGPIYVAGVPMEYRVTIDTDEDIGADIGAIFAAWDPDVDHHKTVVIAAVDQETGRRVLLGHEWPAGAEPRFSLSPAALTHSLGLYVFADPVLGVFAYPYTIRTIDNLATYAIADADEARAFALHAAVAVNAIVSAGRDAGIAILAATTSDEVDAAADDWLAGS